MFVLPREQNCCFLAFQQTLFAVKRPDRSFERASPLLKQANYCSRASNVPSLRLLRDSSYQVAKYSRGKLTMLEKDDSETSRASFSTLPFNFPRKFASFPL